MTQMNKTCKKCNKDKELCEFRKHKACKLGVGSVCKVCVNNEARSRYKKTANATKAVDLRNNIIKTNKKICSNINCLRKGELLDLKEFYKRKERPLGVSSLCKSCLNEKYKEYYYSKGGKLKAKEYNAKVLYKRMEKDKHLNKTDPIFNLTCRIRSAIRRVKKRKTGSIRFLEYSIEQLKYHLESKFQPGMSWDNKEQWHIDHILALKKKNLDGSYYWDQEELADPNSETFKKAWSLDNLQPLWAIDNIIKGNK